MPQEKPKILALSGPNLQLLGGREPAVYGKDTLDEIHEALRKAARERGAEVDCRQSNHEGELLDWIGAARKQGIAGILINPGAYTHTSIALYDALKAVDLPAVEVHLSNPEKREAFRRRSRVAPACVGKVAGFGARSYTLALAGLLDHIEARRSSPPAS